MPAQAIHSGCPWRTTPNGRIAAPIRRGWSYDERMHEESAATVKTSLGELEAFVLSALWEKGELSTPDVFNAVGVPRGLAYTTILTVLQRLHRKGLVSRRAAGKAHVYSPTVSRNQFSELRAEVLAAAMVKLGSAGLSAFLSEADPLDPQFIAHLRAQLSELER